MVHSRILPVAADMRTRPIAKKCRAMLFSQSILRAEWKARLREGIAINANKPSRAQSKTGHPADLSLLGQPERPCSQHCGAPPGLQAFRLFNSLREHREAQTTLSSGIGSLVRDERGGPGRHHWCDNGHHGRQREGRLVEEARLARSRARQIRK